MATFGQRLRLLQGLFAGDVAHTGPLFVNVDLTRRCNLRCIGCRFHSPLLDRSPPKEEPSDIEPDLFYQLCAELQRLGTRSVTLTGEGEPLLHPSLPALVRSAKEAGFDLTLVTNGTLLDDAIVERLVDARLDQIKVSLWAGSPEDYRSNHPGTDPRNFDRVREGLARLARRKRLARTALPRVVLHFPLNRSNHRGIGDMVELARAADCDALSFSPSKTDKGRLDSLSLTPAQEALVRRTLRQARVELRRQPLVHNIEEVTWRYALGGAVWRKMPCYIAWTHARVLVDGTVLACHRSEVPMGNLGRASLEEIWNGEPYRRFRRRAARNQLHRDCDCFFCGFAVENARIHRIFRWLAPIAGARRALRDRRLRNGH